MTCSNLECDAPATVYSIRTALSYCGEHMPSGEEQLPMLSKDEVAMLRRGVASSVIDLRQGLANYCHPRRISFDMKNASIREMLSLADTVVRAT